MKGTTMATYTASVTGAGALAERFEVLLDVLGDATLVGSPATPTASLFFDVSAHNADAAVEAAYFRAYDVIRDAEVTFTVVPSRTIEGRRRRARQWLRAITTKA